MVVDRKHILDAMHANTYFQMEYFPKLIPNWNLQKCADVSIIHANIADDTFNYVINAHFNSNNVSQRVREVISVYTNKLPFSWWVSEFDDPPNLAEILVQNGLEETETDIGMYCTDLDMDISNLPIAIQHVQNTEQLKGYYDVYTAIGGSSEAYERLFKHAPDEIFSAEAPLQIYIGYIDDKPVLTGTSVLHAGAAGIYGIMTHPDHRRKGYGTAMMKHLMKQAHQKDYTLATLQASAEGKSLYEKLGFKSICKFVEYGYSP